MVFIISIAVALLIPGLTILFTRIAYREARDPWGYVGDNMAYAAPAGFIVLIFGILFSFGAAFSPFHADAYYGPAKSYDLAALNLKTEQQTQGGVGGAFTFLWGSVDSHGERKIDYIQDVTGDGGFAPKSLAASDAIIYEGDGAPHVNISHKWYVNDSHVFLPWTIRWESEDEVRHQFFVPKGSIISDFTVDNKK